MTGNGESIRRCPACGRPEVNELLDEVEETFDAFFDAASDSPLRITLDLEEDAAQSLVSVPSRELQHAEETLSGVAQALMLLEGLLQADDLRELVRTLAEESTRCSDQMRRRLSGTE